MITLVLSAALSILPRVHGPETPVAGFETVPAPKMEMRMNAASATTAPWVDANGWRYMRGAKRVFYDKLPPGAAPLAAAEAFVYGAEAVLQPADEDKAALQAMLDFLKKIDAPRMPVRANIGVVDDGSKELGEALNLMARRNLLYRVVSQPDAGLDLNIRIGDPQFPREATANPSDFAARVREKLTDDKRLVRIFNTYTVIAFLTGEGDRARLHLLNYGRRPATDVRVRVLGSYRDLRLADSKDPSQQPLDVTMTEGGTEWTVPVLTTYAVVDLQGNTKGEKHGKD